MSTVTDYEPRTYRGADFHELLPKIREELGPDAIVVRQREGLDGGVGGFFQRRCVEVVARRATPGVDAYDGQAAADAPAPPAPAPPAPAPPAPAPPALEPPAPAIREIMRVASPFIQQLQAAQVAGRPAGEAPPERAAAPRPTPLAAPKPEPFAVTPPRPLPASQPVPEQQPVTGAYGASAYTVTANGAVVVNRSAGEQPAPAEQPPPALRLASAEAPAAVAEPEPGARSDAAAAHERTLVAAGIAPRLAAELVAATISHVLPFGPRRTLKRVVREALARRVPLAPPVASGGRAIALVGAGGAGKTLCVARLATAYAQHSDLDVTVMSLAAPAGGVALRDLLEPAGVDVLDARSLGAQLASGEHALTLLDTPAVSPAAAPEVKALAATLKRLGSPEVHVAVPATLSSAAVRALLDGFAALRPAAIVLTHLDEVGHAGHVIGEAIARGVAISYTSAGGAADGFGPADPAALAARVLA